MKILFFLSLLFSFSCHGPNYPVLGPSGEGWVVYNQKYNKTEAFAAQSSSKSGNTTTTTTMYYSGSSSRYLEGSYNKSKDKPGCQGYLHIKDCMYGVIK
ncbi:hypothetical protein KKF34_17315 [Myxococcota bacterium]|nr:hypothetical protein [Myxococcota bacterium]MBU1380296.1 hypothetical protein [Myxococcota bacterium]MBU1498641.1 hypothetical protein [Myxococcota bacterium]